MNKKLKTVSFHTLGCKLNYAETSSIARKFEEAGYKQTEFSDHSDVYVLNTCSVTENADRECRRIIRGIRGRSPGSVVAVIGCYAQLQPGNIAAIEGVDLVLGAKEKFNLLSYIENLVPSGSAAVHCCEVEAAEDFTSSYSAGHRTRTFLKVQDGCDYTCSYCTIPLARGKSRSDTISHVVEEARRIGEQGIKEIVLTGVNIGDFGINASLNDQGRKAETFYRLIQELDQVESIERFRISSIEPNLLKDHIIEFVAASKRFVPHFHVPLQSGSNILLKNMRRRYNRELFAGRVQTILEYMPHACIGVDVIAGFPGETEELYLESFDFIKGLDISYLHVFTYSERPGTDALELNPKVEMSLRKDRTRSLRILSDRKQRAFYEKHTGSVRNVLFEAENKNGMMHGFTDNYIKVAMSFNENFVNEIRPVNLYGFSENGMVLGKLVQYFPDPV